MKTSSIFKKAIIPLLFCGLYFYAAGQSTGTVHHILLKEADSLLRSKMYLAAGQKYSAAFEIFGWRGMAADRYSAAQAWALAGVPDSAFFQLDRIATKGNFEDVDALLQDSAFAPLRSDARWETILKITRKNRGIDERYYDAGLFHLIDSLKTEDQRWRNQFTKLRNAAVWDTLQIDVVHRMMKITDSLNYDRLKNIVDKNGFPNADKIANDGVHSFWLLVQHQDAHPAFQDSVLQLMSREVTLGKASGIDYAYLMDRVQLNSGKLQVYGTQMSLNADKTSYEPRPVIDPEHLNERRKTVGLEAIESYIQTANERYFGTLKKQ